MSASPVAVPSTVEPELEWDRFRSYLRSDRAPLALIEVESLAQADDLVATIRRDRGDGAVEVYRPPTGEEDPRPILAVLAAWQEAAPDHAVFLVLGPERFPADGEKARRFWTWIDSQRERWRPASGKLAFVLSPRQVDALCRFAGALWDWIPLKFNLLRTGRPAEPGELRGPIAALDMDGGDPGEAARLLPALRQQLVAARQQGLPESVIRREYAWPLFRTLINANRLREAAALLKTDLAGDFAEELTPAEQFRWWGSVGRLFCGLPDPSRAEKCFRAQLGLAQQIGDLRMEAEAYEHLGFNELLRELDAAERWYREALAVCQELGEEGWAGHIEQQLGVVAQARGDLKSAEQWYRRALAVAQKLGHELGQMIVFHLMGSVARERADLDTAEKWLRKSLAISERLGCEVWTANTQHELGSLAALRKRYEESGRWLIKSVTIFARLDETRRAKEAEHNFLMAYENAVPEARRRLEAMWQEAGLGPFPQVGEATAGSEPGVGSGEATPPRPA